MCSCLNAGLTAERINLKFGVHIHIWSDCAIGYMILTFEVIKGHFRSNKFLCKVPSRNRGEPKQIVVNPKKYIVAINRVDLDPKKYKSPSALTGPKGPLRALQNY